ncbi:MAG: transcriptional regulator, partial [Muribaculaceae bacterium]|nr:transcriptional regulator [Muribaculaceae bacterium]
RQMMGEYGIDVNEKCVITACDNIAYVKKPPCIADLMADAECGSPYDGTKESYILDFTDSRKVLKVMAI